MFCIAVKLPVSAVDLKIPHLPFKIVYVDIARLTAYNSNSLLINFNTDWTLMQLKNQI